MFYKYPEKKIKIIVLKIYFLCEKVKSIDYFL